MATSSGQEKDHPALNPFGSKEEVRDDAVAGYLEMSDGAIHPGMLFLTRAHRLKIFDSKAELHRQVPLRAVARVDCTVLKEWMEKEWRFKENANDEKVYTGHAYPAREYVHTITLKNGRTIRGALSGIVYVQAESGKSAARFLLHKRDRGETGTKLKALLYVRTICLGEQALQDAKARAALKKSARTSP